ncbi:hypothetical protein GCM10022220_45340 [Actinocatenispora rupis]|uniref:LysM domain-containing protein n=1 Tax=Actinocatenispora rupis TaxID=519421 RepID=A0A8J3NCW8_9ACTN|nr:hypothetical protein Aru02nite_56380 [Actinocatenispora rupis]
MAAGYGATSGRSTPGGRDRSAHRLHGLDDPGRPRLRLIQGCAGRSADAAGGRVRRAASTVGQDRRGRTTAGRRTGGSVGRGGWRRSPGRVGASGRGAMTKSAERPAVRARAVRRPRPPVRLTRRGRLVVGLAVALLAIGLGLLVGTPGGAEATPRRVEVRQGDTLWSLADRYAPSRDPVGTIERIRHLNHLSGYTIYPGQELTFPVVD